MGQLCIHKRLMMVNLAIGKIHDMKRINEGKEEALKFIRDNYSFVFEEKDRLLFGNHIEDKDDYKIQLGCNCNG